MSTEIRIDAQAMAHMKSPILGVGLDCSLFGLPDPAMSELHEAASAWHADPDNEQTPYSWGAYTGMTKEVYWHDTPMLNIGDIASVSMALEYAVKIGAQKVTIGTSCSMQLQELVANARRLHDNPIAQALVANVEVYRRSSREIVMDQLAAGNTAQALAGWGLCHGNELLNQGVPYNNETLPEITSLGSVLPKKYKKATPNPLLNHTRWIFSEPGPEEYVAMAGFKMMNKRKFFDESRTKVTDTSNDKIQAFGQRLGESCYSVVWPAEPDPLFTMIRKEVRNHMDNTDSGVWIANMAAIISSTQYPRYLACGLKNWLFDKNACEIYDPSSNTDKLVSRLTPSRMAWDGVDDLDDFIRWYETIRSGEYDSTKVWITDITDQIYDTTSAYKLYKSFQTNTVELKINIPTHEKDGDMELLMIVGSDLPKRTVFNKIAKANPTVKVVAWMDGPKYARYMTIVESDYGHGFWRSGFANLHVCN